jgi:hypothetical protein
MRKPDQSSNAENLEEVADRGRLLLVTFFGKTSDYCRATPDGVGFELKDER